MSDLEKSLLESLEFDLMRDIDAFVDVIPEMIAPPPPPVSARATTVNAFPELLDPATAAPRFQPAAAAAPATPPPPAPAPASSVGGGLLARMKAEAASKLSGEGQGQAAKEEQRKIQGKALEVVYKYMDDLCKHLNVVLPPLPARYDLLGLATLANMNWQEGRTDYRLFVGHSEDRIFDNVTFNYRIGSPEILRLTRDTPTHITFRNALMEWDLAHSSDEIRTENGVVVRVAFRFACMVKACIAWRTDIESGALRLAFNNVRRFGKAEYLVPPAAVDDALLDDLGCFLMGEESRFDRRFKRVA